MPSPQRFGGKCSARPASAQGRIMPQHPADRLFGFRLPAGGGGTAGVSESLFHCGRTDKSLYSLWLEHATIWIGAVRGRLPAALMADRTDFGNKIGSVAETA